MRLLFVIHALTGGGAERVMATLMNCLTQRGYEIFLLTDTHTPFAYDIDKRVKVLNLKQKCPINLGLIKRRLWEYILIRHTAKQVKCDVVISFLTEMNCTVTFSLIGTGIPVICSEHSNILRTYPFKVKLKRRVLYNFSSVVTVLTHHDYKLWKNKYSNCVRMPNPCNLTQISRDIERKKVVLAVGRIKQWDIKGFDNLLRAWSKICLKYQDWKLQICGDYDRQSLGVLKSIIEEMSISNVEFLGFRRDVVDLMDHSSIFCLSSRIEGLPMALIEAMSRGCCCVAFDVVTGPSEIIKNNISGILAENQNVNDLADCLERCISNNDLREKLSRNAPFSVQKYDTEKVVDRWELLFSRIVK